MNESGKIKTKGKYSNFTDLKRKAVLPAMKELYELYHEGLSEVWFDCVPYQRQGSKIISVLLMIYTKDNPKQGSRKIWEEGDEPLNPFEEFSDTSIRNGSSIFPFCSCRCTTNVAKSRKKMKLLLGSKRSRTLSSFHARKRLYRL